MVVTQAKAVFRIDTETSNVTRASEEGSVARWHPSEQHKCLIGKQDRIVLYSFKDKAIEHTYAIPDQEPYQIEWRSENIFICLTKSGQLHLFSQAESTS